jgi:uncharacterized protein
MSTMEPGAPLPPYSFVPGGRWPHPISSPEGHSFGRVLEPRGAAQSTEGDISPRLVRGAELFNAGYYWEAHDVWEILWHAYGRHGPAADAVKALIKLAAAGVKVREKQEHGVRIHSRRAADLFASTHESAGRYLIGLDLVECERLARKTSDDPPVDPGPADAPVVRVFDFQITIERPRPAAP